MSFSIILFLVTFVFAAFMALRQARKNRDWKRPPKNNGSDLDDLL